MLDPLRRLWSLRQVGGDRLRDGVRDRIVDDEQRRGLGDTDMEKRLLREPYDEISDNRHGILLENAM